MHDSACPQTTAASSYAELPRPPQSVHASHHLNPSCKFFLCLLGVQLLVQLLKLQLSSFEVPLQLLPVLLQAFHLPGTAGVSPPGCSPLETARSSVAMSQCCGSICLLQCSLSLFLEPVALRLAFPLLSGGLPTINDAGIYA